MHLGLVLRASEKQMDGNWAIGGAVNNGPYRHQLFLSLQFSLSIVLLHRQSCEHSQALHWHDWDSVGVICLFCVNDLN